MTHSILVVDDEPDLELLITQRFRREIRKQEMEFSFAQDGKDALEMFNAEPAIEIVLCDINMPRMDGLTLLGHLQDIDRLHKVVMVSAYGDMKNIRTAMNRGAFDFVTKPIEFEDIKTTVDKALSEIELFREVQQQREEAESARDLIRQIFNKYVPESVAETILNDSGVLKPEIRTATILFTDIADFTAIGESKGPEGLLNMLNEYFSCMAELITQHNGVVNQFQGDAILATFNVPLEDSDHAANALRAAIDIRQLCENEMFDGTRLITRVGVNSGQVIAGSVGASNRLNYTVHGTAVNLAARLEQLNKEYETAVLLSEATQTLAGDGFDFQPVGEIDIRGAAEPMQVFTLKD
jgi:adenylate cyclase